MVCSVALAARVDDDPATADEEEEEDDAAAGGWVGATGVMVAEVTVAGAGCCALAELTVAGDVAGVVGAVASGSVGSGTGASAS